MRLKKANIPWPNKVTIKTSLAHKTGRMVTRIKNTYEDTCFSYNNTLRKIVYRPQTRIRYVYVLYPISTFFLSFGG